MASVATTPRAARTGRAASGDARVARRCRRSITGGAPACQALSLRFAIADLLLHLHERLRGALNAYCRTAELTPRVLGKMLEPGLQRSSVSL